MLAWFGSFTRIAGLQSFKCDLQADELAMQRVELAIITFGPVQVHAEFRRADGFEPRLLHANGNTPMGEAIMHGLDMLEARKKDYKQAGVSYFRPWVFLITDGGPTDAWQEWEKARLGISRLSHLACLLHM